MPLRIVIDTREQQPWHFPMEIATVARGTLNAGDYALEGDRQFAIERKSIDDFVGTLTTGWGRFQNELERMVDWEFCARVIIVEATFTDIVEHRYNHPKVAPKHIIYQVARLTLKGVSVLFCDNPISAAGLAYALLLKRYEQLAEEFNAVRDNHDHLPTGSIPEA